MVSEVPRMIVLWNFITKSKLKASLAGGIFCLTFFSRKAAAHLDEPPLTVATARGLQFDVSDIFPFLFLHMGATVVFKQELGRLHTREQNTY